MLGLLVVAVVDPAVFAVVDPAVVAVVPPLAPEEPVEFAAP